MAEKRVSELPEALSVTDADVFVIEQSGIAKKVTAETLKENFGGNPSDSDNTEEMLVTDFDLSDWNEGSFTATMSDGSKKPGSVTFDSEGNPASVTFNGHTMTITLPA